MSDERPDGWSYLDDEARVRAILCELQEMQAVRDNLTATQGRCNVLLEENHQLKCEKARLCGVVEKLLGFVAEEANEDTIAFIMEKVKVP